MSKDHVRLKIPTTCGELIQGPYLVKESLISLPIDRYTEVEARLIKNADGDRDQNNLQPKAAAGFLSAARFLGLSARETASVQIDVVSPLAPGKGYATSTADICGVIAGVFELFDSPQSPEILAKLCAQIEPSDGLMFRDWTLFNHLNGTVLKTYKTAPDIKLLILEPSSTVMTDTFRSKAAVTEALSRKTKMPYLKFEAACSDGSIRGVFEAASASIMEHQVVLAKPFLEEIHALAEREGAYGVVGAHSGTVLGLAMPEGMEERALLKLLSETGALEWYRTQFVARTVFGGYELL
ncbi:GHMP family kinase ATP-binding protein [Acidaminobacter hydrogenoformans]|uniref:Threonine kinase n=1 Tax=Acidaminobacter hydrogenoformans DSM 2784 TaxID=1120920 RepID=A0A1G5S8A1_9FIRM|nr:hypothetical protein [Acidaminobacter hydrogenoformans]SCZ81951.1 threonine kinase [Acidaminobacter hydrogenoformans DSM 2784]